MKVVGSRDRIGSAGDRVRAGIDREKGRLSCSVMGENPRRVGGARVGSVRRSRRWEVRAGMLLPSWLGGRVG